MSWKAALARFLQRQFEKNSSSLFDALCRIQNPNNESPQERMLREMGLRAGPDPPVGIQPPAGSVSVAFALGLSQADAQAAAAAAANSVARGTAAAAPPTPWPGAPRLRPGPSPASSPSRVCHRLRPGPASPAPTSTSLLQLRAAEVPSHPRQ